MGEGHRNCNRGAGAGSRAGDPVARPGRDRPVGV